MVRGTPYGTPVCIRRYPLWYTRGYKEVSPYGTPVGMVHPWVWYTLVYATRGYGTPWYMPPVGYERYPG